MLGENWMLVQPFSVLPYLKILRLLLKASRNPSPNPPTLTSISRSFASTVFISTIRSRLGVLSRGVPWLPWEPSRRSKLRRRSTIAGSMLFSFCKGLSRQRGYSPLTSSLITLSSRRFPSSCLNLVFLWFQNPGVNLLGNPEQVIETLWVLCLLQAKGD